MTEEAKLFPIAEEFSSIQGEGCYTGTPMRFIRLAGCSVGVYEDKKTTEEVLKKYDNASDFRVIYPRDDASYPANSDIARHSVCTSIFGESFICDTNYRGKYKATITALFDNIKEEHVCLTGGEPFNHDVGAFIKACLERGKMLHIETSGTVNIQKYVDAPMANFWITCSPKKGFIRANIPLISEWKFVVGPEFHPKWIEEFFNYEGGRAAWDHPAKPVFLQPVQFIERNDRRSIERVLHILNDHPGWRLSAQLHKFLELR